MINIPQLIKVSVKTWFEISVTPSCFFKVSRWRWVPHLLNFLSYIEYYLVPSSECI